MPATTTTAERIERALAASILRGERSPGDRLPPIRELAKSFDVTVGTMQRSLARLEQSGLVVARQGSGVVVQDPDVHGGVSLVPAWLDALADQPERAATIFADFLEVRRVLAGQLFARHRDVLRSKVAVLAEDALRAWSADPTSMETIRDADLRFCRMLIQSTGNVVALAVFNTAARLMVDVPAAAAAMYAKPADNLSAAQEVLAALVEESDVDVMRSSIERALRRVDERAVSRFRTTLLKQQG